MGNDEKNNSLPNETVAAPVCDSPHGKHNLADGLKIGCEKCSLKERFRSWPVWLAILGAVGIILNSTGVLGKWGLDTTAWNAIVNGVGGVFIALGAVNNPTTRDEF